MTPIRSYPHPPRDFYLFPHTLATQLFSRQSAFPSSFSLSLPSQTPEPFSIIQYWLDLGRLFNKRAALLRAQSER